MANNKEVEPICLITCWYGTYPWYFSYFIHSCSYNPTIDFYIITDNQQIINNKPENVKIIYKTLEEIKALASKKLGFALNINCPYKLCDFKPAYGFLFPELIKDYDFWGHGDLDVVYGNIRNFMTKEILNPLTSKINKLLSFFTQFSEISFWSTSHELVMHCPFLNFILKFRREGFSILQQTRRGLMVHGAPIPMEGIGDTTYRPPPPRTTRRSSPGYPRSLGHLARRPLTAYTARWRSSSSEGGSNRGCDSCRCPRASPIGAKRSCCRSSPIGRSAEAGPVPEDTPSAPVPDRPCWPLCPSSGCGT